MIKFYDVGLPIGGKSAGTFSGDFELADNGDVSLIWIDTTDQRDQAICRPGDDWFDELAALLKANCAEQIADYYAALHAETAAVNAPWYREADLALSFCGEM